MANVEAPNGNMPPKLASSKDTEHSVENTKERLARLGEEKTFSGSIDRFTKEVNIYEKFNPYRLRDNTEPFIGGFPIIFMTTPDMNVFESDSEIFESLTNFNSIFSYLKNTDLPLLKSLQYGNGGSFSPFIKFLTNKYKSMSLKDIATRTQDEYETYYGWKQVLPGPNTDSFTAESSLSINFNETKNLDITKFHYAWNQYIEAVRYGLHEPSGSARRRREIDYTSSLYFFLLDFDMSRILYFTKYTGIYPINIPLSSVIQGDIQSRNVTECSITYAYQYKEEFRPEIILDFNMLSSNTSKAYNTYDDGDHSIDTTKKLFYQNIVEGFDFDTVKIKAYNEKNFDDRSSKSSLGGANGKISFYMLFSNSNNVISNTFKNIGNELNNELERYGLTKIENQNNPTSTNFDTMKKEALAEGDFEKYYRLREYEEKQKLDKQIKEMKNDYETKKKEKEKLETLENRKYKSLAEADLAIEKYKEEYLNKAKEDLKNKYENEEKKSEDNKETNSNQQEDSQKTNSNQQEENNS